MSLFRRWFGKPPPPEPPDTTVVPPGHVVKTCAVPTQLDPSVYRLEGGACVAYLGRGSDEPVEELDGMLRQVERLMADQRGPVLISQEDGPLSRLFAPANPT